MWTPHSGTSGASYLLRRRKWAGMPYARTFQAQIEMTKGIACHESNTSSQPSKLRLRKRRKTEVVPQCLVPRQFPPNLK